MTAASAPALRVRDVVKTYALGETRLEVLRGVGVEVPRGQMCAVMGPSGVGKSTLLNCIAGLDVPDRGHVEVLGQDIAALDDEGRTLLRRRRIGIVYQFFNLVPTLTALENVTLPLPHRRRPSRRRRGGARAQSRGHDRARRAPPGAALGRRDAARLHRPRCGAARRAHPRRRAHGERNVATGRRIMALLAEVVREAECALLLVTHNPEDAARADRVVFMKDGAFCDDAELAGADISSAAVHDRLKALGI